MSLRLGQTGHILALRRESEVESSVPIASESTDSCRISQ